MSGLLVKVRTIKEKHGDTEIWEKTIWVDVDKIDPNPYMLAKPEYLLYLKELDLPYKKTLLMMVSVVSQGDANNIRHPLNKADPANATGIQYPTWTVLWG